MSKYTKLGATNSKYWGSVHCLHLSDNVKFDYIVVKKGGYSSTHCHNNIHNKFILLRGKIKVVIYRPKGLDETILEYPMQSTEVEKGVFHKFEVLEDAEVLEVYYMDSLNPDDISRLNDGGLHLPQGSDEEIFSKIQDYEQKKYEQKRVKVLSTFEKSNSIQHTTHERKDMTTSNLWSQITSLNLNNKQISDVTPLAGLTSLQRLHLGGTQVSDVTPLARLTKLEMLFLDNTQVTDVTPLARLTSLEGLDLNGTQVSDVTPLAGLTSLETLYLGGTKVSEAAVEQLQKALPKCTIYK